MSNYNKQIYYMYEEEVNKNKKFNIEIKELKLENKVLKQELTAFKNHLIIILMILYTI